MITTLDKIRAHHPCREGWYRLLRHLNKTAADEMPLSISTILGSNGLDDAIWCLRAVEGRGREIRLYAVWCARRVQHLMTDRRSLAALDVAERHARGCASDVELKEAAEAGRAAYAAAWAATSAAESAAYAAWAATPAWPTCAAHTAYAARQAGAAKATQADELRRICREIEAGRDPYPEETQP